jgi:hypothetical protein
VWRIFAAVNPASRTRIYPRGPAHIRPNIGIYAGRMLKSATPSPVAQPTSLELEINLKTVKALAITVPQLLLAQADELIKQRLVGCPLWVELRG